MRVSNGSSGKQRRVRIPCPVTNGRLDLVEVDQKRRTVVRFDDPGEQIELGLALVERAPASALVPYAAKLVAYARIAAIGSEEVPPDAKDPWDHTDLNDQIRKDNPPCP